MVEFALAAETARCLVIEDSNTGAKSGEAAGCTVLVVPNQVPVLDGPLRVFVDGSREHGVAELGVAHLEAAPPGEPSVSSLYIAIPFHQDASVLIIGERTNTNGSKAFREEMLGEDWQKCLDIAKGRPATVVHERVGVTLSEELQLYPGSPPTPSCCTTPRPSTFNV